MSPKPSLDTDSLRSLVVDVLGEAPRSLERLVEGMESQAFRVSVKPGTFVVRINPSLRGFEKDRWAASFLGGRAPVPRVVALGALDADLAYCISEWTPGQTLEALPDAEAERLADEVARVWRAIAETDVSSIGGFGDFDPNGSAPASSWHEVLVRTAADARHDLSGSAIGDLPNPIGVISAYERLIELCPEERALVHGDAGSNNVLVERDQVSAVLDWDLAMVGDPLYDVANFYFWASHLSCMRVQASYFSRTLSHLRAYDERVTCYAIRIGLEEARQNLRGGDRQMTAWALTRTRQLLSQGLGS